MGLIVTPWTAQPRGAVQINRAHPLAQFVSLLHVPTSLDRIVPNGRSATLSGVTQSNGYNGPLWQADGNTNAGVNFGVGQVITGNVFTIAVLCAPANSTGIKTLFSQRLGSGNLEQTDFVIGASGLLVSDSRGVELYYRSTVGNVYVADNGLANGIPDSNWHLYGATRDAAGTISVWRDGDDITSSRTTPSGTFVSTSQEVRLGNLAAYTFDGTYSKSAPTSLVFVLNGYALDSNGWHNFTANPWQLLAPRQAKGGKSFSIASGTVALIGESATSATGAAVASITAALTGQAATSATGNVVPAVSKALTGQAATSATGTATAAVTAALTGQAATSAAGTINASSTGQAALTGSAATAAAGTVSVGVSKALSGSAATAATGTVTPVTGATAALTSATATAAAGTVSVGVSRALIGTALTAAQGAVSTLPDGTLVGQQITTAQGTLTLSIVVPLHGASVLATAGLVNRAKWVDVNDAQSPGWAPLSSTQSGTWTPVNDIQ